MLTSLDEDRLCIAEIEVRAVDWATFQYLCANFDISPSTFIQRVVKKVIHIAKKGEEKDAG
jgi:hypothetical protein